MSVKKKYLKTKPVCKVTFEFEAPNADKMSVAGDFNDWNEEPMKKLKNGTFKTTVDVDAPNEYEFKYIVDGEYVNDPNADAYQYNSYSGNENSVISV